MQKIGRVQRDMLKSLHEHHGWSMGCGWIWDTESGTRRILASLVKRGLVTPSPRSDAARERWDINAAGLAVIADDVAAQEEREALAKFCEEKGCTKRWRFRAIDGVKRCDEHDAAARANRPRAVFLTPKQLKVAIMLIDWFTATDGKITNGCGVSQSEAKDITQAMRDAFASAVGSVIA